MEMQRNPVVYAAGYGVVTALTLTGGMALGLVLGNVLFERFNVHMSGLASGLLVVPLLLGALFGGGALWGAFVGNMTNGNRLRMAKVGALTYGTTVILAGIALELVFGLLSALGSGVDRLPIHVAFTLVFVPSAGIIAALCARRMARTLGRDDLKGRIGTYSGVAAAGGFLAVNMLMLSLGWQVGGPGAAERFTMITVMLTSNVGTAVAGGAAMGWVLHGQPVEQVASGDAAVRMGV